MSDHADTRRPLVLGCIMLAMFVVAVELTVVATAMPSVVAKLGGLPLYSWVFTGFLLTQAGTTVIFGKLADLYGRKPVMLVGLAIFLVGSVLCGLAHSMEALILYRLVQGLGGGAILPVAVTIVGDIFTPRERAAVQGWISSVWAISAVLGPLLGGFIVQHLSWPWVFWINVPLVLVTGAGFVLFLKERVERRRHSIDVLGASLFFLAIAALLLVLTAIGEGRGALGWGLACAAVFAVAAPLFLWQERRASEPMVPLGLWMRPAIGWTNAATFVSGMTFMGVTTFLPIYIQGVLGGSATQAGIAIGAMSLGWPVASVLSRRLYVRIGVDATNRLGALLLALGSAALLALPLAPSLWAAGAAAAVIGAGMGFFTTTATILVQASVEWAERGAATSAFAFSRTLGNMLGAAILGAVLNGGLAWNARRDGVALERVQALLDGAVGAAAPEVRRVLSEGMTATFLAVLVMALASAVLMWRMPTGAVAREFDR